MRSARICRDISDSERPMLREWKSASVHRSVAAVLDKDSEKPGMSQARLNL